MLTIREFAESDLPLQDVYFKSASDDYLRRLGVNPDIVRSMVRDVSEFRRRLETPVNDRKIHGFAFDLDGEMVGSMALKQIKFGESCDAHGHIFQTVHRRQKIGQRAFIMGIKRAFEMFKLQMIFFEPNEANPAPNALLKSLGLPVVDTYDIPAGGILLPYRANRYEVRRDWFYEKFGSSQNSAAYTVLQTTRTRLRRLTSSDYENVRRLETDPLVVRFTSHQRVQTEDETLARLAKQLAREDGEFGIWIAETHERDFVGWVMLLPQDHGSLELGYMIVQEMWGKGFASEICGRLMEHAGSRKVIARCDPKNEASLKILKKLGFHIVSVEGGTVHLSTQVARGHGE